MSHFKTTELHGHWDQLILYMKTWNYKPDPDLHSACSYVLYVFFVVLYQMLKV